MRVSYVYGVIFQSHRACVTLTAVAESRYAWNVSVAALAPVMIDPDTRTWPVFVEPVKSSTTPFWVKVVAAALTNAISVRVVLFTNSPRQEIMRGV